MNAAEQPIFVLGILPRSGTNFLYNLLMLHPDCAPPDPVWEDFLVTHLDLLADYSDTVASEWDALWGVNEETRKHLDRSLGAGISLFLQERCNRPRVVSKTPRVESLTNFFRFFPDSKLLILVRDGRSMVESAIKTFGWRREPFLHALAQAARMINSFNNQASAHQDRFRIIRYEDLWQDTESALCDILKFLELDMGVYDLQAALNLPVRGSSELKTGSGEPIHWDPVERTADFDPMSRFKEWSDARHFRYNKLVGREMQELGYALKKTGNPGCLYSIQGLWLDLAWTLKSLVRPFYLRLRRS